MTRTLTRRPTATAPPADYGQRPYDLVKEFVIALVVVTALTVGLAAIFSSPNEKAITFASWAKADPADFRATALSELDGTSGTATYGPPYNSNAEGQKIGPINLQKFAGVRYPIDTAKMFVLDPLRRSALTPRETVALQAYLAAPAALKARWTAAAGSGKGNAGPVPILLAALTRFARSGGLDGVLMSRGNFFATDGTPALLFLADGSYLEDKATAQHLAGDQWGMMNETGSFPGQAWLWLYTFWYQVKPFSTSDNADALVWGLMMLLTLAFILIPFIPGVRSIPRWIPIYRLVWRDYYREQTTRGSG
jgi:hypothetical protein